MKKLSSQYGHHLSLTTQKQQQQQSEIYSSTINEASVRFLSTSQYQQTFSQLTFSICDIIGNYNQAFIIIHSEGKLYLVDQHAASEKSLYVQFLKSNQLFPVNYHGEQKMVQIQNIYKQVLLDSKERLYELGWSYEIIRYGPIFMELRLKTVPSLFGRASSTNDFIDIVTQLYTAEVEEYSFAQKQSLASTACHSAYRIGHELSDKEMRGLTDSLQLMDAAFNCPHGRPIIVGLGNVSNITENILSKEQYDL